MAHQLTTPLRGVVLASACAAAIGCQRPTVTVADLGPRLSAWQPDSAATLAHESYSGIVTAVRLVVTDSRAWGIVWQRVYSNVRPEPPRPTVDFGAEAVLVASLGERGTGGYDIRIDSIVTFDSGIEVHVTAGAPGPACVTTQALTQPVHMVRVSRPRGPVFFEERSVVRECR